MPLPLFRARASLPPKTTRFSMATSVTPLPSPSFPPSTAHKNLQLISLSSSSSSLFLFPTKPKGPIKLSSPEAQPKWRTKVSFFPSFLQKNAKGADEIKQELLEAISPLDRGAEATPEDQQRIDEIARKLEALNSIKEPLKSDLINGNGSFYIQPQHQFCKRPKVLRPNGKIYQAIQVDTLRAQNMETWPFFNQAVADLIPLNSTTVAVKWDTFKIAGLVPIKAPDRPAESRGQLEITYLDEEIRVSRGNQGNLFILKMVDPSYRVPV